MPTRWGAAALISAAYAIFGVVQLRRSRLRAYTYFRIAVLIALLTNQFFVFSVSLCSFWAASQPWRKVGLNARRSTAAPCRTN